MDLQLIEMCVKGISEQASYKKVMEKILTTPTTTD